VGQNEWFQDISGYLSYRHALLLSIFFREKGRVLERRSFCVKTALMNNTEGILYSVLLELWAQHDASLPATMGHLIHAMFHQLLTRIDPALSARLHQEGGHRPFTLSPLFGGKHLEECVLLIEGMTYQVRITLLDGGYLWHCLSTLFLEGGPCIVRLGKATLLLTRLISTADATGWAGKTTWQELARQPHEREITLSFASPTAFNTNVRSFVLVPEPLLVWGSLIRTWNSYAPASLAFSQTELREILTNGMTVLKCDLSTCTLRYPKYTQKGFVGRCSYLIPKEERYAAQITCLASFAQFACVGYKTTMGMGQARRVDEKGLPTHHLSREGEKL
jgi:CRISPR-associated endoribonuclease Cas6